MAGLSSAAARSTLEAEFERELHGARPTLLVLSCYRPKTLVQHLCRLAERSVSEIGVDVPEVRVIQQIEGFSAKL